MSLSRRGGLPIRRQQKDCQSVAMPMHVCCIMIMMVACAISFLLGQHSSVSTSICPHDYTTHPPVTPTCNNIKYSLDELKDVFNEIVEKGKSKR